MFHCYQWPHAGFAGNAGGFNIAYNKAGYGAGLRFWVIRCVDVFIQSKAKAFFPSISKIKLHVGCIAKITTVVQRPFRGQAWSLGFWCKIKWTHHIITGGYLHHQFWGMKGHNKWVKVLVGIKLGPPWNPGCNGWGLRLIILQHKSLKENITPSAVLIFLRLSLKVSDVKLLRRLVYCS